MGVPVVAIVDTNTDPRPIDYVIPPMMMPKRALPTFWKKLLNR